jgi:hypothetical protein
VVSKRLLVEIIGEWAVCDPHFTFEIVGRDRSEEVV